METEKGIIGIIAEASQFAPDKALELWESTRLQATDFKSPALGVLWEKVGDFVRAGLSVDVVAVAEKAKGEPEIAKAGGQKFISEVLLATAPSRHILPEYARMIATASLKRKALELLRDAAKALKSDEGTPEEALTVLQDGLQSLTNRVPGLRTSEGDVLAVYTAIEEAISQKRALCIPTGIEALDEVVGGLQASVLTMVGAYPGVGKSAFLSSMAYSLAERGVKVGFFSLEDERLWLARRMLSYDSGATVFGLTTGKISEADFKGLEAQQSVVENILRKIIIDDRPGLTPSEIITAARDMVLNHKAEVIMLDHLGEVRLERTDRYDLDIAEALSGLRDIAKRFKVPVVVASHVRRRMGLTVEDAPALTDFANSSAPERMARVALGLSKVPGGVRCSILKQTNGPSGGEIGLRLVEHAAMIQLDGRLQLPEKTE